MSSHRYPPHASHASRTRIAQGQVSSVDVCDCGSVHLQIGPASLALHPEALNDLQAVVEEAVRTLWEREAAQAGVPVVGAHVTERGQA